MRITIFEDSYTEDLFPLTYTRHPAEIRVGIDTLSVKWERLLDCPSDLYYYSHLASIYNAADSLENSIWVNGRILASPLLKVQILEMPPGTALVGGDTIIAAHFGKAISEPLNQMKDMVVQAVEGDFVELRMPSDIFRFNRDAIIDDFHYYQSNKKNEGIKDSHSILYGKDNIFVEAGCEVRAAIINAEDGPVYLGKNSKIQEGAIIRGAHGIGEGTVIKMGAKLQGDSSFGPFCKVGGEVSNSVMIGYSNKGHDGYMGNSVIGEWCNLGADTNTSNLKNNYSNVKVWNYPKKRFLDTSSIFCGLIMGDHSKCGINTMFNTGTVVGISANIFGSGYPRNFIPSFSWGGAQGWSTYNLIKVIEVAEKVMMRRGLTLSEQEKQVLEMVFISTSKYRKWEK